MTYEDPRVVGADMAFEAIAPLLWIRAGCRGSQVTRPSQTYSVANTYGVLFSIDSSAGFAKELAINDSVRIAFIVTDDGQPS